MTAKSIGYAYIMAGNWNSKQRVCRKAQERAQKFSNDLDKDELDGCMVPTRPHKIDGEEIGGWKEMKLGRIFRERDHLELGSKPNLIRESIYVNHFGNHQDFTDKLEVVVDRFENLDEQLVFINDDTIWIAKFSRLTKMTKEFGFTRMPGFT
ncbi:MAG: hypothetical protein ACJAWV_000756 [Flammeovirgaceae bacterium]|jgi:hypothetical protein